MGAVVSLDGYIAHTDGDVGPLFDWLSNGEVESGRLMRADQPVPSVEETTAMDGRNT